MDMLNIINNSRDIYFNLALEEYLLRKREENIFMIWQSDPCIVAGKHQNIMAEVNHSFAYKNGLQIARRLTGGGTVYHGPGNINFTFLMEGEPGKLINYPGAIQPIVDFLKTYGIIAEIGEKNDLLIDGRKISGNAQHIYKTRILHHGTLLYNANLDLLKESIRIKKERYIDKAIQSNPSQVTNISECMRQQMSIDEFATKLNSFLINKFSPVTNLHIEAPELDEVRRLQYGRYSTIEWIYGYSPDFEVRGSFKFNHQSFEFNFKVRKGIITESYHTNNNELQQILKSLIGTYFYYENMRKASVIQPANELLYESFLNSVFE
jgi:lipoate-protein ligase A